MQFKPILFLVSFITLLSGCIIADSLFTTPNDANYVDLQTKSEEAIKESLQNEKGDSATYKPYRFTRLVVKEPKEITEFDALEKQLKKNPSDTSLLRKVTEKKEFIRENGIERTARLNHFYKIENEKGDITVVSADYIMNDTLGVKSYTPRAILELDVSYKQIIDYYFNQYSIFKANTYAEGKELSISLYNYFEAEFDRKATITERSTFLKHTFNVCRLVKENGNFNPSVVTQLLFRKYIEDERKDILEYKSQKFSPLYETRDNEKNELIGYYFFHQFNAIQNDATATSVVLVEFSPYYKVENVFQLDGTFESYTN